MLRDSLNPPLDNERQCSEGSPALESHLIRLGRYMFELARVEVTNQ